MSRLGTMLRRVGIIGTLVCWFSSSVGADPIRSSLRFIHGSVAAETPDGSFGAFMKDDATDLPGLFNSVLTDEIGGNFDLPTVASYTTTQHSDVSGTSWSGSGTVQTDVIPWNSDAGLFGIASAESVMFIDFTLAQPMAYQLAGTLTGEFAAITLNGPTTLGWTLVNGGAVPLVVMRRGLLSPGDYHFDARAFSGMDSGARTSGRSAFDVQFGLDPVPEPATLLLFATGAALGGRTAWRRRREQSTTAGSAFVKEA